MAEHNVAWLLEMLVQLHRGLALGNGRASLFHAPRYSIASAGETQHEIGNQGSELCDRWNDHHQGDIAPGFPGTGTFEDVTLIATDHRRQVATQLLRMMLPVSADQRAASMSNGGRGLKSCFGRRTTSRRRSACPPASSSGAEHRATWLEIEAFFQARRGQRLA